MRKRHVKFVETCRAGHARPTELRRLPEWEIEEPGHKPAGRESILAGGNCRENVTIARAGKEVVGHVLVTLAQTNACREQAGMWEREVRGCVDRVRVNSEKGVSG